MTDLTEQWKKGELPEGHYYVKDGENMIAEYLDGYFYNNGEPMTSFSGGVDKVLAPVPSYDEWKASYNCMLENEVLRLKNAQLKEKIERLEKQLKIAVEALGLIDKRKCHMANCLQNCPLKKYYEKDKGCATCLNKACHTALQQIKELEK